ncbi:MAG: ECF transporter S component [Candidatus Bathyarchaeia archaeon]
MGFRTNRTITLTVAQAGIMAALVAVATYAVQVPIPATKGYLNFGDIMIFVSALTFGPLVGSFAGGVGSALSDVAGGYASTYAPFTLIIKGAEGIIVGLIAKRGSRKRSILAVAVAGVEMVSGYFLAEFFGLSLGWAAATEVPFNILQIVAGGVIGIPIAVILWKRLPEAWLNPKSAPTVQTA